MTTLDVLAHIKRVSVARSQFSSKYSNMVDQNVDATFVGIENEVFLLQQLKTVLPDDFSPLAVPENSKSKSVLLESDLTEDDREYIQKCRQKMVPHLNKSNIVSTLCDFETIYLPAYTKYKYLYIPARDKEEASLRSIRHLYMMLKEVAEELGLSKAVVFVEFYKFVNANGQYPMRLLAVAASRAQMKNGFTDWLAHHL